MNAIDLFAGCGGLSKGFMDAGLDIIVGVDNDQAALNTFAKNHNGAVAMKADLTKQETFDEIKRIAGDREIEVVIAGPPCQGFSLTGPRNFDDERNKLYLAVIEIVKQYKPTKMLLSRVSIDSLMVVIAASIHLSVRLLIRWELLFLEQPLERHFMINKGMMRNEDCIELC